MNEEYPCKEFEKNSYAFLWLKGTSDENIIIFIKNYLTYGSRHPFPSIARDERIPCHSLAKLIFSAKDIALEERIKKILSELIVSFDTEFERYDFHNREEYFYNLFGISTIFRLSAAFPILCDYAKNNTNYLINNKVYNQILFCFVLSCLFSYHVPDDYKKKITKLCESSIKISLCSPLCYREAYEIYDKNFVYLMSKYLTSVRGRSVFYRFSPIKLFLSNPLNSSIFDDEKIRIFFLRHVVFNILDERKELEKFKIVYRIKTFNSFDINIDESTSVPQFEFKKIKPEFRLHVTVAQKEYKYRDDIPQDIYMEYYDKINELAIIDRSDSFDEDLEIFKDQIKLIFPGDSK